MVQLAVYMQNLLARPLRSDRGASAVEYGLLVFLIALIIIGAVGVLGGKLNTIFTDVGNAL